MAPRARRDPRRTHHSLVGDVGDEATARATASLARETFGKVDLLVNNAGIYPERPLLEETPEFYDRTMRTNLRGVYLMTVAVLELMPPGGAIVCTASTCSFRAIERHAAYNVSKGAVAQLARSFAVDLAPRGIRVNAVAPGVISAASTNMWVADPATWANSDRASPRTGSAHRRRSPTSRPSCSATTRRS